MISEQQAAILYGLTVFAVMFAILAILVAWFRAKRIVDAEKAAHDRRLADIDQRTDELRARLRRAHVHRFENVVNDRVQHAESFGKRPSVSSVPAARRRAAEEYPVTTVIDPVNPASPIYDGLPSSSCDTSSSSDSSSSSSCD